MFFNSQLLNRNQPREHSFVLVLKMKPSMGACCSVFSSAQLCLLKWERVSSYLWLVIQPTLVRVYEKGQALSVGKTKKSKW